MNEMYIFGASNDVSIMMKFVESYKDLGKGSEMNVLMITLAFLFG
jgi:hypothetical protein